MPLENVKRILRTSECGYVIVKDLCHFLGPISFHIGRASIYPQASQSAFFSRLNRMLL
jgi:hypothetical protein